MCLMKKFSFKTGVPIYSWAEPDDLDDGTLRQIKNLANLPFAFHHIALMADAHVGYGMPIGGVLATKDYIIPNAVGVDIGCGMITAKTDLTKEKFIQKRDLVANDIYNSVPLGFNKHNKPQKHKFLRSFPDIPIIQKEIPTIKRQLGTLGGGNHFIDTLYEKDSSIWIMIHSGSRNIGKKIADVYHQKARKFTRSEFSKYPSSDLACLSTKSSDGQEYLQAMNFAQQFAAFNREQLMGITQKVFSKYFPDIKFYANLNVHHNYAKLEEHFGQRVWIHRKGAISAGKGQKGIIPGSMASPSYIIEGKGNSDSFNSASHGAGRQMSRTQSRKQFKIDKIDKFLADADILLRSPSANSLKEEFTHSYKSIDSVIEAQKKLIRIKKKLAPIMVIIG